jgi:hypothetical protein
VRCSERAYTSTCSRLQPVSRAYSYAAKLKSIPGHVVSYSRQSVGIQLRSARPLTALRRLNSRHPCGRQLTSSNQPFPYSASASCMSQEYIVSLCMSAPLLSFRVSITPSYRVPPDRRAVRQLRPWPPPGVAQHCRQYTTVGSYLQQFLPVRYSAHAVDYQ